MRNPRNRELALLAAAILLTGAMYALASLGRNAEIPSDLWSFLGVITGLLLFAHVVLRKVAPNADPTLLPLVALLNGVGYVFIARLSGDLGNGEGLPRQQALWTAVGIAAFTVTLVVVRRTKLLDSYRYLAGIIGLGLLVLPLIPGIGREVNSARIWVRLGPISFQPAEFAKLALAVFIASTLAEKAGLLRVARRKVGPLLIPEPKHLAPVLGAWALSIVVMVAEKDLGSSLLLILVVVTMLWISTGHLTYLALGLGMFITGGWIASRIFGHVEDRIAIWLHPFDDPNGIGFQPVQAAFALAEGGLAGTGLGRGEPTRIPEVETDFIFAAIGEELGLLGSAAVLVAFVLLVGTGFRIALGVKDPFAKLLATALSALIGFQAFIIIGGIIRIVPLTGITLPFVSYGGSSLVSNYVLVALLLRISDEAVIRPDRSSGADAQAMEKAA